MQPDIHVRVAVLETNIKHLTDQLDDTHKKVEEMHALLMQAQGAKWAIVGMAALAGFIASMGAKFLPWFWHLPK